ncbi:MAG: pitrilysin family protein [Vampirovibrionales bacterium]|nr:pitrilysin family protein [Vampirovibrionales bacterium]
MYCSRLIKPILALTYALSMGLFFIPTAHASMPEPVLTTLPNGHRVISVSNPNSSVVTIDTWVDTGSVNETLSSTPSAQPAGNNGVSHFLEHLLFKGTATLKPGDLDRLLERRGANFNAATSDDYTHYHLTTPVPYFEEALRLHGDMLLNAALRKDDVDRERPVVQEEIHRATDNPNHDLFQALTRHLYGANHPYALDTLGPKALIASMPLDDIRAYYRCWYQPSHLTTVVAGGITAEQALTMVQEAFTFPKADHADCHPKPIATPQYPKQPVVEVLTHPQLSDAKLILAFESPSLNDRIVNDPKRAVNQATPRSIGYDALAEVLAGGRTARLVKRLREDNGWVTDISAGNLTQRYGGMMMISAEMAPNRVLDVARDIVDELHHLESDGISASELQRIKTAVDRDFVYLSQSTEDVASTVGYYASLAKLDDYTQYRDRVAALSQEELNALAKTAFPMQSAVLLVMLPENPTEAPLDHAHIKKTLKQLLTQPAKPSSKVVTSSAEIVPFFKTKLAQGPTLIVKSLPEASTVAINISIPGGSSVETTPGTAKLTAQMLSKGSTTRTLEQLNALLDDRHMSLTMNAGSDAMQAEGVSVTEDWPLLLNTMADVMQHPAFTQSKLAQEQALMLQELATSLDAPSSLMFDALNTRLYGRKSPYGVSTAQTVQGVQSLKRRHLQRYHHRWLTPDRWIVTVVGNVDPETIQQTLSGILVQTREPNTFKNLPKATSFSAQTKQNRPVAPLIHTRSKLAATWMGLAWLGPSVAQRKDYLTLKVINSLMGSGMSSILFRTLREQQSLAYQVASSYGGKRLPSAFMMYLATAPQNEQKALDGLETQRQRLISGSFTDADLDDAKSKLVGAFAVAHETPAAQANYLALFETLGLEAEFDERFRTEILAVTRADVLSVAKRYLSGPPVISIVKPE